MIKSRFSGWEVELVEVALARFGLVEKDVPCAIMTITAGVDLGSL